MGEEAALLIAAPAEHLRRIERLMLSLVLVPRAESRLRALRLKSQAETLHYAPMMRMKSLRSVSQALKTSSTLRQLLRAVARLGSWINSADMDAQRGFALSSALGKLPQFKALRGDRGVSLLHIVALSVAGGDPSCVWAVNARLNEELGMLTAVSKEELSELGCVIADFSAEADWLLAESERSGPDGYSEQIQKAFIAIHEEEFAPRVRELTETWSEVRTELGTLLVFFAEQWTVDTLGPTVEHLLQTVEEFLITFRTAAREVAEQPDRFARVYNTPSSTMLADRM